MTVPVNRFPPDPGAPGVMAGGTISGNSRLFRLCGQHGIPLLRPLDFPFGRPPEIIAHDHRPGRFKEEDMEAVVVATDSRFTRFLCTSPYLRTFRL